jgi:hypothetical protein
LEKNSSLSESGKSGSDPDIYRKYGIADKTIVNAIKNKEEYEGFQWEYV